MWTRSNVASFWRKLRRAWPWLTALDELVVLLGFGLLFAANELRVALSYHPETRARNATLAGYEACEDIAGTVVRWAAICLIPILLGQCVLWSWIREANADRPRMAWLMPITTLLGLVLLAFLGFLSMIAVSASMVG